MARGCWPIWCGSRSSRFGCCGRGFADELIALPLDKHDPTPLLGDNVVEPRGDVIDEIGSSR